MNQFELTLREWAKKPSEHLGQLPGATRTLLLQAADKIRCLEEELAKQQTFQAQDRARTAAEVSVLTLTSTCTDVVQKLMLAATEQILAQMKKEPAAEVPFLGRGSI